MAIHAAVALALSAGVAAAVSASTPQDQADLGSLEVESHQRWLSRDREYLSRIMDDEFHLVVMNGAVETRADVVGSGNPDDAGPRRQLAVRSMTVHPDEVIVRGDTGIVVSTMHIDASFREQLLPPQMRVLSVFTRSGDDWALLARSITPIRQPRTSQ